MAFKNLRSLVIIGILASCFIAFDKDASGYDLTITEINYNSDTSMSMGDWFELYNYGSTPIDLTGWRFVDQNNLNQFNFPNGTQVGAGSHLVVCRSVSQFQGFHPGVANVVGDFGFGLSNAGDQINLYDAGNVLALHVAFSDSVPWPKCADGAGRTMELKTPLSTTDILIPTNWFNGCLGGSPGTFFSGCTHDIVFNEINYRPFAAEDNGDWVELHNLTNSDIDLTGYTFNDRRDTLPYIFGNVTLPANGYLVVSGDLTKFSNYHGSVTNVVGPFSFGLSGNGEVIRLYDENGLIVQSTFYNDALPWPQDADGFGFTLDLIDPLQDVNDAANWRTACKHGSPGIATVLPCPIGISDLDSDQLSLQVHPNPVTNQGHVRFELNEASEVFMRIVDVQGKTISKDQSFFNAGDHTWDIENISHLESGMYFVELTTLGNASSTAVLVKQ